MRIQSEENVIILLFCRPACTCQFYLHRNVCVHVYLTCPLFCVCRRLPVLVAKRMEAVRAVYLASRSNITRWRTVELSRKAKRLYKVSENGTWLFRIFAYPLLNSVIPQHKSACGCADTQTHITPQSACLVPEDLNRSISSGAEQRKAKLPPGQGDGVCVCVC